MYILHKKLGQKCFGILSFHYSIGLYMVWPMTGIQVMSTYIYKYYKTFGPKTLYQHNTYGEIALCKVHTNSLRKQLLIVGTYNYTYSRRMLLLLNGQIQLLLEAKHRAVFDINFFDTFAWRHVKQNQMSWSIECNIRLGRLYVISVRFTINIK